MYCIFKKTQTLINSVSISFQNIQTIYVLLSIVGVVILLIVILCLIPFSESSKKRETAYLQGITIKKKYKLYFKYILTLMSTIKEICFSY